jgi:hypothetical protein
MPGKRKRFIATSVILSLGFIGIQFVDSSFRLPAIMGLGVFTIILYAISLYEGLGKNATLLTLILPFLYTVGVGFFWFLLPSTIFTRIPVVIIYAIGIYALCLTMNIYTVSAIRTIALLRAARGVGFFLTLLTSFFIFDTILSLRVNLLFTSVSVFLASFLLYLQGFWAVPLEKHISKNVLLLTLVSSLEMGQIALGLYFWPVTVVVGSLFLTVIVYVLLGLGQAKLENRLFHQTIREYLTIGVVVFIGMFLATTWAG